MTSEQIVLGKWDEALNAAGIPSDAALMWLGVVAYANDAPFPFGDAGRRFPEQVAEFASTCHRFKVPPSEGIRWYQTGISNEHLGEYLARGRGPSDYRAIRRAIEDESKVHLGRRGWSARTRSQRDWMLSALPTDLVVACIRAGYALGEVDAVLSATDYPLSALETLAALRGYRPWITDAAASGISPYNNHERPSSLHQRGVKPARVRYPNCRLPTRTTIPA